MSSFHGSVNPNQGFSSRTSPFSATLDFIIRSATDLAAQEKHSDVTTLFEKSIVKAQENPERLKELLIRIWQFYVISSQYSEVIKYLLKLEEILCNDNDRKLLVDILYEIGVMYFKVWECNNAINYLERSLDISREMNYHAREASCYCNLGNANLRLLKTPDAIKFFKKALDIYLKEGDKRGVANNYLNLGSAYFVQKQFKEAITFFNKGLEVSCQIGYHSVKEKAYIGLGDVCLKEQQYNKAIDYLEKALTVNKITSDKLAERKCNVNLGDAYFSQKQFMRAIEYFQKNYRLLTNSSSRPTSVTIPSQVDSRTKEAKDYAEKGTTYLSLGQCKYAIDYLTKSLEIYLATSNLSEAGNVCDALGNAYYMLKKYKEAKIHFKKAIAIFEKSKNGAGKASAFIGLGNVYQNMQEFFKAIESYEKALKIGIEIRNVSIEGKANGNLGNSYINIGEYTRANEYYLKSLRVAEDIGDQSELAQIYENLGTSYLRLGNYNEAKYYYESSLSINEKMGIREKVGITYGNLATVYLRFNQYEKSNEYLKKCLAISVEFGDVALEAKTYGNLGGVCYARGQLREAIDYHEKEARIYLEIKDQSGLGYSYTNMANAYDKIGKCQKAIDFNKKAINIFKQIGDRASLGTCLTNLGIVYEGLGQFSKAIRFYEEGCNIDIQLGNRPSESNAYCHLGNAHYSLGKYEEAIHYHNKHYAISVELGNLLGKGEALANLANVYRAKGEHRMAIDHCEQALTITLKIGRPSEMSKQYSNLAASYCELGDYEKAVDYFKKSRDVSLEMGDKQQEACCDASIGTCYIITAITSNKPIKTPPLSQANALLKKAIRSMDNLLSELVADKDQTSAYNQYYHWHVNLGCSFIALQKPVAGLLVFDIGRSKALQLLIEHRAGSHAAKDCSSANSYRDETWRMIETEKDDERVKDIAKLLEIHQSDTTVLIYAFDFLKMLHIWIICNDGSVHHKTWLPVVDYQDPETAEEWLLKTTKNMLKDVSVNVRGTYSFFNFSNVTNLPGEDALHQTTPDLPSTFSVVDHRIQFERDLDNTRNETPPVTENCAGNVSDTRKQLYQALVGSVESLIKGNKLIIVPDKFLFFVPFCSLLSDESDRLLVDDHAIQMAPSLHTLASGVLASNGKPGTRLGPALFVGNPCVGEISFQGRRLNPPLLPAAGEEAKGLATKFLATALVEDQATKGRVLERLGDASIVHIAAHGEEDNGEIFLAPNPESRMPGGPLPTEKSYLLRQEDVISVDLNTWLVVLCCCNTGCGEVTSEGVLGLARSFLAAGARCVLVALWRIPDRETKVFMEKFYDNLCNGRTACEALKTSMNMFCQSSDDNRRSFRTWAPFTIYGEDVKFSKNDIEIIKETSRKMPK